jgi:succinylarginine dihydrolase
MSTMIFSVEEEIKRDFNTWAKRAKKSKSDLFRDMVAIYLFNLQLENNTDKYDAVLDKLGIQSENELYEYLESNETYNNRIRHQRVSSGKQKK